MPDQGPEIEHAWSALVGQLSEIDVSVEELDEPAGIWLLAEDDEPFDSVLSIYDALERSVARQLLSNEQIELVFDFAGQAIFKGKEQLGFLQDRIRYEIGDDGRNYAIITFAPSEE
jgi:hypothetical protein